MVNHTRRLQEVLDTTNPKLEPTIVTSAPPDDAAVLVLHTIGPANRAYLGQDATGRLSLHFRGLRYGVDDFLPSSIFGLSVSPSVTAGEFVCRQMLRRHGDREQEWPALARQFLLNHTNHQPDRSQARGSDSDVLAPFRSVLNGGLKTNVERKKG